MLSYSVLPFKKYYSYLFIIYSTYLYILFIYFTSFCAD